jgi:hypothetical protein
MNRADEIERQLKIEERWSAEDPHYLEALKYIDNRTFINAVERLEGLVVQRLFELSKANLAATGVLYIQLKVLSSNRNIFRLQDAEAHLQSHRKAFFCHSHSPTEV